MADSLEAKVDVLAGTIGTLVDGLADTNKKVDKLASSVAELGEMMSHVVSHMATKDDIANMATKDDIANMATKDDIANMATKDDISHLRAEMIAKIDLAKEEILDVVRPIERAVDADAETIVRHEARILRVERHLDLAPITA